MSQLKVTGKLCASIMKLLLATVNTAKEIFVQHLFPTKFLSDALRQVFIAQLHPSKRENY